MIYIRFTHFPAHTTSEMHTQLTKNRELFYQWTEHCRADGTISHYSAKCHPPIKKVFIVNILRTVIN